MNTTTVLIGNISALLAMITNAFSATRKTSRGILLSQNLTQAIYCITAIILGGYSAAVQNAVSILRNFAAIGNKRSKVVQWGLVLTGVVLGVAVNNRGLIGLLPVISNLMYTIAVFRFVNKERALKISFLISVVFFVVFNLAIMNFVGALADTVVIVTTAVALIRSKPKKSED